MEATKKKYMPIVTRLYEQRGPFNAYLFIDECKTRMRSDAVPTVRDVSRIMRLVGFEAVGKGENDGAYSHRPVLYGPRGGKREQKPL